MDFMNEKIAPKINMTNVKDYDVYPFIEEFSENITKERFNLIFGDLFRETIQNIT